MRVAAYAACFVLVLLAGVFSFLALLATGGDSAFADRSRWIYVPWLVALVLTHRAVVATARGQLMFAMGLIAGAGGAYMASWLIWDLFSNA
jgi:hypothetical protein